MTNGNDWPPWPTSPHRYQLPTRRTTVRLLLKVVVGFLILYVTVLLVTLAVLLPTQTQTWFISPCHFWWFRVKRMAAVVTRADYKIVKQYYQLRAKAYSEGRSRLEPKPIDELDWDDSPHSRNWMKLETLMKVKIPLGSVCDHRNHSFSTAADGRPLAAVAVFTTAMEVEERDWIRHAYPMVNGDGLAFFFPLGVPAVMEKGQRTKPYTADKFLQQQIEAEAAEWGDIVQGDFFDVYENLAQKTFLMYMAASTSCGEFLYLAKHDRDAPMNFKLLKLLLLRLTARGEGAQRLLWGTAMRRQPVIRDKPKHKNNERTDVYPYEEYYDYPSGPGYLLTMVAAKSMAHVPVPFRFFVNEDAFSGMLAHFSGVEVVELKPRVMYSWGLRPAMIMNSWCEDILVVHATSKCPLKSIESIAQLYTFWKMQCSDLPETDERPWTSWLRWIQRAARPYTQQQMTAMMLHWAKSTEWMLPRFHPEIGLCST